MERYAVEYRPEAMENLLEVAAYVFDLSQNVETTEAYIGRIYARCEKIGDAPFGGVARDDLGAGVRMAVFEKSVVILYTIVENAVWITNIFFGSRDYATLVTRA
ncbi:type II toxin-antitoxin system RelE/ParE family toxin [Rhizobium lusitanum]|uniref:Type II toxin-antitoxin system RelE/ParE family toxin n=1 Tax=Rhizobium lusitanum TaxID=293958 RepID=A0A6L9UCF7_9HYPH|nr:type II toxin-antitoxin system RelE/ParE family toxin [Rhizobium lusitanum]NEI73284.1 type II toxin-antitoxin system RelE/ParE family toxin [Rhizobium lusitanum]